MPRKYFLIVIFALLVFLTYRPVKETIMELRGVRIVDGVAQCEYEGRSYRSGEQRQAEDGCNACTCGDSGWNCTQIACAVGGAGNGTLTGALTSPSGKAAPSERVCAISLKEDGKEYCQQTVAGEKTFAITATPGTYWVYASLSGDESGKRAYWSAFVKCGGGTSCKDHSPIPVTVTAGQVNRADPQDWSSKLQIDLFNITPSKWEYDTHNYYPNSEFLLKSRGLSAVTIMTSNYPPVTDASFFPLGQATLASTDHGIQTWTLPVPEGFQAGEVYAVGIDTDGTFTTSRTLRIVRPIDPQ